MNQKKKEQGFTLLEVLFGILMASVFISSSLQLMLASSMMRLKANQRSASTEWIRQEIENVRLVATTKDSFTGICGQYGKSLREEITKGEIEKGKIQNNVGSGGSQTLTPPSNNFALKAVVLERTMTDDGDSLKLTYRALLKNNSSSNSSDNQEIDKFQTEVIPYAVFENC